MDLENLKIEDTVEDVKGKKKEDTDEDAKNTKTEESEEVESERDFEEEEDEDEEEDESQYPLELGGFLTPVNKTQPPIAPPKEVMARDLSAGQAILLPDGGRPVEIVSRTDTRAQQGPLASRHKISFELYDLWDRETLDPLVVKATEKLRQVHFERVRYEVVGFCSLLSSILFGGFWEPFLPSLSLRLSLCLSRSLICLP